MSAGKGDKSRPFSNYQQFLVNWDLSFKKNRSILDDGFDSEPLEPDSGLFKKPMINSCAHRVNADSNNCMSCGSSLSEIQNKGEGYYIIY